jgi:hypothetical protein
MEIFSDFKEEDNEMGNELALARSPNRQLSVMEETGMDIQQLAVAMQKSGYFKDIRDASQAIVKMLAGREIGLGAVQSLQGFYIVKERITQAAQQMAFLVKRSGRYNYRVLVNTAELCTIQFYEIFNGKWEESGVGSFSMDEARTAELTSNPSYKKYPIDMMWSRAMARGARHFCPDALGGVIYTPEELGAEVSQGGEPITITTVEPTKKLHEPTPKPPKPSAGKPLTAEQKKAINDRAVQAFTNKEDYFEFVQSVCQCTPDKLTEDNFVALTFALDEEIAAINVATAQQQEIAEGGE